MGGASSSEGRLPPTPSGQQPTRSDSYNAIPDINLPPQAHTPAPAPPLDETWGTKRRMEALISQVDQAGVEEMIDRAMKRGNAPKFMAQYQPQGSWLWRQWQGTVVQRTWPAAIRMMGVSLLLVLVMETARMDGSHTWTILEVPNPEDQWVARMRGFTTMWGYLLTMATCEEQEESNLREPPRPSHRAHLPLVAAANLAC